jgi:hypothetical protein
MNAYASPEKERAALAPYIERLDVKLALGAAQCRARVSGVQRFLSGRRPEFPTIDRGQNLSSARLEP